MVWFKTENQVEVVPHAWLRADGKACWWPPFTHLRLARAIEKVDAVNKATWQEYGNIRILFTGSK